MPVAADIGGSRCVTCASWTSTGGDTRSRPGRRDDGTAWLVWPGKDKFLLVPKDESGKPVWVERDHPAASEVRLTDVTGSVGEVPDEPFDANLLFTGDSLDVLRVLAEVPEYRSRYRGKVKLSSI